MSSLRDYQKEGVKFLASGRRKLLLDDPGLGKTVQAIRAFNLIGAKKVLIVCPAPVKNMWATEINKWSLTKHKVQVIKTNTDWLADCFSVVVVGFPNLSSPMILDQIKKRKWSVCVVDEIHYCSSSKSKRTKALLSRGGIISRCAYFWGLTGTPMTNTPINLYPIIRSVGKKHFGSKSDWMYYTQRYCGRYQGPFGWVVSGCTRAKELGEKLFGSKLALRRDKKSVLKELPDMQYSIINLSSPDRINKKFSIVWSKDITVSSIMESVKSTSGVSAPHLAELRKLTAIAKVDRAVEYIDNALTSRDKVLVFTWHREVTEGVSEKLKVKSSVFYGGLTDKEKEQAKSEFIDGDSRVLVANITSAGTGIDGLQKVCDYVVYVEIPWSYYMIDQSTGRLWRLGQKNKVTSDLLVLEDSVEAKLIDTVMKKRKYNSDLLLTQQNN